MADILQFNRQSSGVRTSLSRLGASPGLNLLELAKPGLAPKRLINARRIHPVELSTER